MFNKNWFKTMFSSFGVPGSQRPNHTKAPCRLQVEVLEDRAVPTASLRLAVMGDSLSASYAGYPGRAEDLSWTQQIQQEHANKIQIFNVAVPGATSGDVLSGQAAAVHDLVAAGKVDYATLIVGANDLEAELYADLPILIGGNPAQFYQTFVQNYTASITTNIQGALNIVSSAGDVGLALGNIPDVTITPAYAGTDPFILFTIRDAVISANHQLELLAEAHHIPVIDLYGLSHLTQEPLILGRVTITNLFAADGFHPNTVAQGLLANTVLDALGSAYDAPVKRFELSDQQILTNADIEFPQGRPTYFDVSSYVSFNVYSESSHQLVTRLRVHERAAHPLPWDFQNNDDPFAFVIGGIKASKA